MAARGVRFGKGLQLTNILRDIAQDVRIGRCYAPRVDLSALGVHRRICSSQKRSYALDRYSMPCSMKRSPFIKMVGRTLAIPSQEWRLRLACAWPLLIGVATLALVKHEQRLLDPTVRVKISVCKCIVFCFSSLVAVRRSNHALDRYYRKLLQGFNRTG
jgi:farnesyl-diphosphate farnesyltransferase